MESRQLLFATGAPHRPCIRVFGSATSLAYQCLGVADNAGAVSWKPHIPCRIAMLVRCRRHGGLIVATVSVCAQAKVVYSNANIWNGLAHQSRRVAVRQGERQRGIRPNAAQRHSVDAELQ
jgi:hypothetical protein